MKILKYISETYKYGILYSHDTNPMLIGYCDAYWVRNDDDRKSTSGGYLVLRNNMISWFSKKKNCVSLSTIEAEYITAGRSCTQLL